MRLVLIAVLVATLGCAGLIVNDHDSAAVKTGKVSARVLLGLTTLVLTMIAQGRDISEVLPALALFAAAAFRLMPSVNRILVAVQSLRYGLPVINVLHDELAFAGPEHIPDREACPFESRVEVTDVTYTYPEAAVPALSGLSMTVQHGESVGVIGPSGSGKSTLVDVLLGLLTPDSGKVSVGRSRRLFRAADALEYMHGEEDPACFWPAELVARD